jgi:hypothetical protein
VTGVECRIDFDGARIGSELYIHKVFERESPSKVERNTPKNILVDEEGIEFGAKIEGALPSGLRTEAGDW